MSGRGGSPSPGGDGVECAAFYKNIPLMSPDSTVVNGLKIGDELAFEIWEADGKKGLHVRHKGEVAGSVTKNAAQLIRCIQGGHTYTAIVTSIDGGSVTLEARMKA